MSQFYDQASLVMVPSGYKSGKIYSQKPLSASGELSFSRASNATRVVLDASGQQRLEKVRTNELLYSNDFSNVNWGKSNATLTGGQSGYDGSTNGWKIEATDVSCYISQSNYSVLRNHSIYAKAGTFNLISIIVGGYTQGVTFNLTDGTISYNSNSSLYSPVITSVGSGWYRVSVGIQAAAPTYGMLIAPNDITGGTISAGEYIYIQSAQTEYNDIATDYIATTTSAVSVGPVSGLPRLDYSGGASCPSLLLEPQRTNTMLQSENLNTSWIPIRAIATSNAATSPDGYANADKLIADTTADATHLFYQNKTSQAAGTYAYSAFFKKSEYEFGAVRIATDSDTKRFGAVVNLNTGAITATDSFGSPTGTSSKVEDYGNGWHRLIVTCAHTSGDILGVTTLSPTAVPTFENSLPRFTGDNTSGVFTWGAQLEAGAYATSYIPTLSSAVTRVADAASKTGISSLIGQTEGTLFCEISGESLEEGGRYMSIGVTGDATNRLVIYQSGGALNVYCGAGASFNLVYSPPAGPLKIAVAYKSGDYAFYVNGVQAAVSTISGVPLCSEFNLGRNEITTAELPTSVGYSQALLFKTRLSNTDLATLTTL